MSKLFSPIKIKGATLKNRIVVSPMCQYSSTDGFADDWHLVHLGSRAIGGASLIVTEATAISPEGRISPFDLGLWKDEHIENLKRITSFIKKQRSVAGVQLAHSGRKGSTQQPWIGHGKVALEEGGWKPYAPSALSYSDHYHTPVELDQKGIEKVIADFKSSAERAIEAGFEVIEVHASHGYLLHQFLSPLTNKRSDKYGGNFENRIRLLKEIIESIKTVLPDASPLFVRVPGTDWAEGGWILDDAVRLSAILMEQGVDVIDVTSGGLVSHQKIEVGPAYQLPFASKIKRSTGVTTCTVGLITNAIQAETILINGDADLIMMAREFLRDPYFPLRAAHEFSENVVLPEQYQRAWA